MDAPGGVLDGVRDTDFAGGSPNAGGREPRAKTPVAWAVAPPRLGFSEADTLRLATDWLRKLNWDACPFVPHPWPEALVELADRFGWALTNRALAALVGIPVRGSLHLDGLVELASLPLGLSLDGDLDLRGCWSLRTLPEGLRVRGSLLAQGCRSLEGLPEGLAVGRDLDLAGCEALTVWPVDLKVGGRIVRDGDPSERS
jgi:hypothetical protein